MGAQEWHDDVSTFEDIKMQIALHDYDERQGPVRFLPTTHRPCQQLLSLTCDAAFDRFVGALPWAVRARAVRAGDATIYFSRTLHAGGPRRAGSRARYILDAAFHSGRAAIDSEKFKYVSDSLGASTGGAVGASGGGDASVGAPRAETAAAREAWTPAAEALDALRRVWNRAAAVDPMHAKLEAGRERRDEL